MHKIFHIDVNSAYLSWEAAYMMERGASVDLRDIPSIVGGNIEKRRGIVLAKSIPAKKYDIQTGESVASARIKCPTLVSVPPNYERYIIASNALVDVVKEYSPLVQRYSIDEMFMDFTSSDEDPIATANRIRERVKDELGFTVNIGVGDNKLLAKMASDFQKPDKVHTLYKHEIQEKLWPLPVRELFMVGSRTEKKLHSRGIETIGDLANLSYDYVHRWLKKPGITIWEFANGIESSSVRVDALPIKSVGNSTTIAFDVTTEREALMVILALCEMVALRLRAISMKSSVIHVGYKNSEFMHYGMERKLYSPTNATEAVYSQAKKIFRKIWTGEPIRHLLVRAGRLTDDNAVQLSLFDNYKKDYENLDDAIDSIRVRYGLNSIHRSIFLNSGISPVIGGVIEEEEYPMMASYLT